MSQAAFNSGFKAINCASVMPNSVQISKHVSPTRAIYVCAHGVGTVVDAELGAVPEALLEVPLKLLGNAVETKAVLVVDTDSKVKPATQ